MPKKRSLHLKKSVHRSSRVDERGIPGESLAAPRCAQSAEQPDTAYSRKGVYAAGCAD